LKNIFMDGDKQKVKTVVVNRIGTMTEKQFRSIALSMNDAVEGVHMGHPDFRANGKIFATIHNDRKSGMVKLTPEQQQEFVKEWPETFAPESGGWGRQGCTKVTFASADVEIVGKAMTLAWQNAGKTKTKTKSRANATSRRS
jgi:hypothetical protein